MDILNVVIADDHRLYCWVYASLSNAMSAFA